MLVIVVVEKACVDSHSVTIAVRKAISPSNVQRKRRARPHVATIAASPDTRQQNAGTKPVISILCPSQHEKAKEKEKIKERTLRKDEATTNDLDEDDKW